MWEMLKNWARRIKRDVIALYIASRDHRTPWYAKAVVIIVVGYALSPIDLIPDFIPIIGYIDDLLLLPLGILLAVHLLPTDLMAEFRTKAETFAAPPSQWLAAVFVIGIWFMVAAALTLQIFF